MVRKWNAQHGRGSRSRGKKMLIFRSARYPKRSRAVCITLLPHARISNAPLVFFTRRGGGRGGAGGRFTNKRRRLNVQGEWPAIWRPPFEMATPQKVQEMRLRCVLTFVEREFWKDRVFDEVITCGEEKNKF